MVEKEINEGHLVEVAQTCHIINCMIDDFLITHIAVEDNKEWVKKLQKAQSLIFEVYQEVL